MSYPLDDTIAAIASPPGGAARGILRLSGPQVVGCLERVFRAFGPGELAAITRASVIRGVLFWAENASPLPCDVYFWPSRKSYTGQAAAEIHSFGSRPLLEAALGRLCASGARLAERGEFTLRAFLSGRIDLTQAEAVLGAVDAADPRQFDVALAQLAGGLAGPLAGLRDGLADVLAHLEAGFDFPDEDLPFISRDQLAGQLAAASGAVARLVQQMRSRHKAAELARVVLVGWPNTGKSSLFNALAGRSGALVSHEPGTTRDYLTAELDLGGMKCLLVDTAGIEPAAEDPDSESLMRKLPSPACRKGVGGEGTFHCPKVPDALIPAPSPIEGERGDLGAEADLRRAAQAASQEQARAAQLTILCLDSTRPLNAWERKQLAADDRARLLVLTKIDLAGVRFADRAAPEGLSHCLATSSMTGEGIEALRARIGQAIAMLEASGGEVVAGTAVRCGESLRRAGESLDRARQALGDNLGEELVAAEVRIALEELGKVVGAVYTDDILDRVFSRFCIGK